MHQENESLNRQIQEYKRQIRNNNSPEGSQKSLPVTPGDARKIKSQKSLMQIFKKTSNNNSQTSSRLSSDFDIEALDRFNHLIRELSSSSDLLRSKILPSKISSDPLQKITSSFVQDLFIFIRNHHLVDDKIDFVFSLLKSAMGEIDQKMYELGKSESTKLKKLNNEISFLKALDSHNMAEMYRKCLVREVTLRDVNLNFHFSLSDTQYSSPRSINVKKMKSFDTTKSINQSPSVSVSTLSTSWVRSQRKPRVTQDLSYRLNSTMSLQQMNSVKIGDSFNYLQQLMPNCDFSKKPVSFMDLFTTLSREISSKESLVRQLEFKLDRMADVRNDAQRSKTESLEKEVLEEKVRELSLKNEALEQKVKSLR